MLCISNITFLGTLQKFEGAAGEFKGALSSQLQLIWALEVSALIKMPAEVIIYQM